MLTGRLITNQKISTPKKISVMPQFAEIQVVSSLRFKILPLNDQDTLSRGESMTYMLNLIGDADNKDALGVGSHSPMNTF